MRFGFCAPFEHYSLIASAGFDYFEPPLAPLLKPESPESEIMPALMESAGAQPIKAEALNIFLPGDLKITGPAVDRDRQSRYLQSAFHRVALLGAEVVVFGSAGARTIPDGFPRDEAVRQITSFLRLAAPIAAEDRVTLVIEPLNRGECNFVNGVAEAMELVRSVDRPSVQVLSDLYHVDLEHQPFDETRDAGAALRHVHVAGAENRRPPVPADIDYLARFFAVLKQMGYAGRISVEGVATQIERDVPISLEVCRKAWDLA